MAQYEGYPSTIGFANRRPQEQKSPMSTKDIINRLQNNRYDKQVNDPMQRFNNPQFLSRSASVIGNHIGRKLTDSDIINLHNLIKQLPVNRVHNLDDAQVVGMLVNKWKHNMINATCDTEIIDTHEVFKNEIGVSGEYAKSYTNLEQDVQQFIQPKFVAPQGVTVNNILGINTPYQIRNLFNPASNLSTNYVLLDSKKRQLSNDGTRNMRWAFSNTQNTLQGTVNAVGAIRDIIELKIMGPFTIPRVDTADNDYDMITMTISEYANQAIIGHGKSFHFLFKPTITGDLIELNPVPYNDGIFKFDNPVTQLDTLTISFGAPIDQVLFDKDRLRCTFTKGNPTIVTFTEDHNLATGDKIEFTNFTTDAPVADASQISAMNSTDGLTVAKTSDTTVTVPIDTSGITEKASLAIVAYFRSKRFFVPMQIRFIKPEN